MPMLLQRENRSALEESSFEVSEPRDLSSPTSEPSFTVIDGISQRHGSKLFEKQGFSYNVKKNHGPGKRKLH